MVTEAPDATALEEAARTHALALGVPPGITVGMPVEVRLIGRSEGAFPLFDN